MVTRKQSASQRTATATKKSKPNEDSMKLVDEFISKLAEALQRRGKRTWKANEVSKALEHAIDTLPDGALKDSLQSTISEASSKLLQHLTSKRDAEPKAAPKAKKAKIVAKPAAKETKTKAPKVSAGPTLLDSSLEGAVDAILSNKPPKNIDPIGTLVSRFPPPEGLLEWQVLRAHPAAAKNDISALLAAASDGLQVCNALASQATTVEEALIVFEPALSLMLKAARALEDLSSGETGGDAFKESQIESLQHWKALRDVSTRTLMCMHLVAKEIAAVEQLELVNKAGWWLEWSHCSGGGKSAKAGSLQDIERAAMKVCSAAVSLCTAARMREGATEQVGPLAAHAGHDMRLLAPYAAAGQMIAAADAELEEVCKTKEDATLFLALYMAAEEQELPGPHFYYLRMFAARNASAAASSLGDAPVESRVLSTAATVTPPPAALEWLRDQPPSGVVLQALESLQGGPQALSSHLIYTASERAVKALAAAAKAGGVLSAITAGGEGGADEGEANPADDLLFFISKEGDNGAFGQDWGSEEEEEQEEEGSEGNGRSRRGLDLEDLPDEGKQPGMSDSEGEDDSESE